MSKAAATPRSPHVRVPLCAIRTMKTEQSRQDRIQHLRKEQERKDYLSDFLASLSNIAEKNISKESVLSLEEVNTVTNRIHYRNSQVPTYIINFPFSQADKLREIFSCLRQNLSEENCYLTSYRFYKSIILLLDSSFIIDKFEEVIELDGNAFYIYDREIENGLMLDSNEENWTENGKTEYVWTYELRVWGKEWVNKIQVAYNSQT
ncbi:hypothetical protein [Pontibacter chitinilyticus]|uniref:hypothetical protein n=1 Tax=Pontibacter chitinilyticus TaxID=2674989 RepID=UPI0032196FE6